LFCFQGNQEASLNSFISIYSLLQQYIIQTAKNEDQKNDDSRFQFDFFSK